MEALGFSKQARRTFHDVPYLLTVSGDNESLSVEVEHAEDGRRWRSTFAAHFIEGITNRTGNAKKFDVFVKMLLSALAQESGSVYIDVLTARDLEMLRRHANPQGGGPPTTSTAGQSDKRYLILTYRAEFDKVHYPLPLPLDERSEEEKLRTMVGRLQAELTEARQTIASLELKAMTASTADDNVSALQRQNADLTEALSTARREVEQLRAEFRQRPIGGAEDARKLKGQCEKLQADLKAAREDARQREAQHKNRDRELRAEKQKSEKLQQQLWRLEEERRASVRRPSAERSRAASRTPSAERARPPSRPTASRPNSRASSVASSRERTPSPSSLLNRPGAREPRERPWAFQPRRAPSPSTNAVSPYAQNGRRRTPSPGTRSRERTPSPGTTRAAAAPASLREKPLARPASRGSRPTSASRAGQHEVRPVGQHEARPVPQHEARSAPQHEGRPGSRGPAVDEPHRPGALFGLAANLGIGPGSLGVASSASSSGSPAVGKDGEACDIDARLQALQSFLKQTKHIVA